MKNSTISKIVSARTCAILAGTAFVAALSMTSSPSAAQSAVFFVYKNCNVSPCNMGVSNKYYSTPGNPRYLEGWRRMSQSYRTQNRARQTMCNWHYSNPRYISPDIASGAISCSAECPKGECRTS